MTSLSDFHNKHAGQMGFILGAGPSLHFQDVAPLKDYPVFAVNSAILKFPQCDYFVTDDGAASEWNYFQTTAKNSRCHKLFFKKKLEDVVGIFDPDKVVWYDHVEGHNPDFDSKNLSGYEMTRDPSLPICAARTSAGSAVHLAYIMGCDPIVLLGCDACYKNGKRYFWQFPGERHAVKVINPKPVYCRADRGSINGKGVDQHCCDFNEYWRRLAKANVGKANIIYASEGGLIDSFPSASLAEVLSSFGSRKKTM